MTEDLGGPGKEMALDVLEAREGEHSAAEMIEHIEEVSDVIARFTEMTGTGNLVYAQSHVLRKAVELLRKEYDDADEYGRHEAEMIATAVILEQEAKENVY